MAEANPLAAEVDSLRNAIRIILENVGLSTASRKQVKIHLGDLPPDPDPAAVPVDPRDAALADLQAQIAALKAAAQPVALPLQASAGEPPADPAPPVVVTTPAEAPPTEAADQGQAPAASAEGSQFPRERVE